MRDIVKDTSTNNIFIANTAHTSSGSQPLTTNTDSAKWDLLVDAASATTAQTAAAASAAAAAASETASAASETASAASQAAAATSATNSANSATASAASATSAAASFDSFDDKYLGAKSSAPSTDNDGDALQIGTLYFNTTTNTMQVYGSSGFQNAGSSVNGTSARQTFTATSGQTSFSITYDAGFVDVYLNGVKLLAGTDFTATSGTAVVLASGATAGDIVDIVAYGSFTLSTPSSESDARYLLESNNLSDLESASTAITNLGITSTAAELNILDGVTATATELNLLDGVTATTAELNYVDGVTSAIQTQIDAKQPYATIAVTVVDSGGNKYALDGTVQQLALLTPSVTYRFDQSDSSNSGHPLRLSTTSNGTHGGGSEFTTGVTAVGTPGSAGAYTQVKLEQDAPETLYYYCTNHSGMGGEIDSNSNTYTQTQADAKFAQVANNLSDLASASTARTNLGLAIGSNVQAYSSNLTSINQDLATDDSVTFNNVVTGTTDHGSVSATLNLAASGGQIQQLTLGASITISSSTLNNGDSLILMVDDGSAYAVTWSGFTFSNNDGVAPTLVTSGYNVFSIWKIGGTSYISYAGDQ